MLLRCSVELSVSASFDVDLSSAPLFVGYFVSVDELLLNDFAVSRVCTCTGKKLYL